MPLTLTRAAYEAMVAHARRDLPNEACGYLGGENGIVSEAVPLTNADASPEHYSFLPHEQFAAVKSLRSRGCRVLAVYHSHPSSPARPSAEDIHLAFDPSTSYVIISLADGEPSAKSFRIVKGEVTPEPLVLSGESGMHQYRIPSSLVSEIGDLENRISQFLAGTLSEAQLKAFRVPFGIYEQRIKGLYMARIRCAAGIISPSQLKAAAAFALRYGSGNLHITTRQELQLHDIPIEHLAPLLFDLYKIGLSTRGGGGNTVRNITASWNAGIAAGEAFDVTPYAVELTSRLTALNDSWLLPRKFKIAFSNSRNDNAFATVNDVGFFATIKDGIRGFKVFVAGGMGRSPQAGLLLHEFVPAHEVFRVAESVKRLFSRFGNRRNKHAARLRFVWNRFGRDEFIRLYEKESATLLAENPEPFALPHPLERPPVELPAVQKPSDETAFPLWKKRYAAPQADARLFSIVVPLKLGNLTDSDAARFADAIAPFGNDVLRFTHDQNITVRNIPETHLANVFNICRNLTPLSLETPLFGSAVACAGASTCQLGICRSRGALTAIINHLQSTGCALDALGEFRLHISGCTNSCGQHAIADLGFAGKVGNSNGRRYPAYTVFAGALLDAEDGSLLATKAGEVPAHDLPQFIRLFLGDFISRKQTYPGFRSYLEHAGFAKITELCETFRNVLPYEDAPHYYRDYESDEDFSTQGRGNGECASGLFDLVDIDMARLRQLRQSIDNAENVSGEDGTLAELALVAARALLITRGAEVADTSVFAEFKRHFLDEKLIASEFYPLIDALIMSRQECTKHKAAILRFCAAIEQLYASMDDSFQFKSDVQKSEVSITISLEKDFRGVACPMNFVKTKMALSHIASGQHLKILLDDGAPVDNVPKSVEGEGHVIVSKEATGDYWQVVIKKV